jgi:hypothetical protein
MKIKRENKLVSRKEPVIILASDPVVRYRKHTKSCALICNAELIAASFRNKKRKRKNYKFQFDTITETWNQST